MQDLTERYFHSEQETGLPAARSWTSHATLLAVKDKGRCTTTVRMQSLQDDCKKTRFIRIFTSSFRRLKNPLTTFYVHAHSLK